MFVHNISPILVQIGPLAIRWYSLVYLAGFIVAYFILVKFAKDGKIKNLTRERVDTYILWLIIGIILGARIFEVLLWNPGYYFSNLIMIPQIWKGGLSFHGGLVGAALVNWWFCRKYKVNFWNLADTLAIPAAIMLGIGRIANFVNAELVGKVSNLPWAVNFNNEVINGELVYRHPSQIYEAIKNFVVFGILMIVKNFKLPKGYIFWLFVTLYGFGRFLTDLFRVETPVIFGLGVGQIMNLIMGFGGFIMLWRTKWKSSQTK